MRSRFKTAKLVVEERHIAIVSRFQTQTRHALLWRLDAKDLGVEDATPDDMMPVGGQVGKMVLDLSRNRGPAGRCDEQVNRLRRAICQHGFKRAPAARQIFVDVVEQHESAAEDGQAAEVLECRSKLRLLLRSAGLLRKTTVVVPEVDAAEKPATGCQSIDWLWLTPFPSPKIHQTEQFNPRSIRPSNRPAAQNAIRNAIQDATSLVEPNMTPPVDTRESSGYRTLRFDSVDECVSDVNQILAAAEAGHLKATGNWTPGEVMTHLANWIGYPYVGFPIGPPPFFIRWILRLRLRKMLRDGMPRGVRIPGVEGGTVGMEDIATIEAGRRFVAALERLQSDGKATFDSPAFGAMSHDDRIALNLRHAELHLGFLRY